MIAWLFTVLVAALQVAVRLTGERWSGWTAVGVRVATRLMALALAGCALFAITQVYPRMYLHGLVGDMVAKADVVSGLFEMNRKTGSLVLQLLVLLAAFMVDRPRSFRLSRETRKGERRVGHHEAR